MSIKEDREESKSPDTLPEEADFDIVPRGLSGAGTGLSLRHHAVILGCLLLTAITAFGAGRLSFYESFERPIEIISSQPISSAFSSSGSPEQGSIPPSNPAVLGVQETSAGAVVASKNSTKYHYPWCSGAKRITEANKRFFASIEEAKAAGLTPAANCPGLK